MGEGRVELVTAAALVFASTFVAVFTLGLQSRLVNTENYAGAGVNSLFIGAGHIALYKVMPDSGGFEIVGYFAGGVIGITTSIWFHKRVTTWWMARQRRAAIIRRGPPRPSAPCAPRPMHAHLDEHAADIYPHCFECGNAAGKPCPRLVCERFVDGTVH